MNKHIKGLLPTDYYHFKCRQVEIEGSKIKLVWTVDVGKFSYRNIIRVYTLDSVGLSRLDDMMDALGKTLREPIEDHTEQFEGLRTKAKVERTLERRINKNVITEYMLPERPADYNVMAEKSDEHFYPETKEKSFPI